MDDESSKRDDTILRTILLPISLCLIAMFILLLIVHCEFQVATEARPRDEDVISSWSFHVGVVTMLFGFVFVALGLPILVKLFLNLSKQIRKKDGTGNHQGERTVRAAIGRIFTTMITMLMLVWETYTGFRIATEPRSDHRHLPLALPFGIVTIVFGSVYFIIGLAILADLALYLMGKLQQNVKTRIIFFKDSRTDVKSFV